jgi:hypothetical protein
MFILMTEIQQSMNQVATYLETKQKREKEKIQIAAMEVISK